MSQAKPIRSVEFEIPGEPVAFARAGKGNGVHAFTPKRQRDFMTLVKFYAHRAANGRLPMEGPIRMEASFFYAHPKSWSAKKRTAIRYKTSRPDTSNLLKIVEDACNEIIYRDDAQIVVTNMRKEYSDRSCVALAFAEISNDQ